MRTLLYTWATVLVLLVGCACDGTTVDPDAGDAGDAGPVGPQPLPFDPGTTYSGEQTTCRFSVQCRGDNQICVDDRCVRQERFSVDALHHGEWRRMTDEELYTSPLYVGERSWNNLRIDDGPAYSESLDKSGIMSWMFPSPDGPQLAFQVWHNDYCKVVTYGRELRVTGVPNMTCFSVATSDDRYLAVGGVDTEDGQNTIALYRDSVLIWRAKVPASIHARLARSENWGEHAEAGIPMGLYFLDGALYASVMRGTDIPDEPWVVRGFPTNTHLGDAAHGLAFLRVSLADGAMELLPVGGKDVLEGKVGWLAEESGALIAFVTRRIGTSFEQHAFERVRIPSGVREVVIAEYGFDGRYFQPTHDRWILAADWSPICHATFIGIKDEPFVIQSYAFLNFCPTFEEYSMTGPNRNLGWETPHTPFPETPAYTGHSRYPIALTGGVSGPTPDTGGIGLNMFDLAANRTTSAPLPPATVSPGFASGSGAYSRFGKTMEAPFWDRGNISRPLGWMEWALTANENDGGGL